MAVTRKIKVLEAEYVKEAGSILIVGECEEGRLRNQIPRDCFSYGDMTEEEIERELQKTAEMMVNKYIDMVFDTDLDGKIKDKQGLKYE